MLCITNVDNVIIKCRNLQSINVWQIGKQIHIALCRTHDVECWPFLHVVLPCCCCFLAGTKQYVKLLNLSEICTILPVMNLSQIQLLLNWAQYMQLTGIVGHFINTSRYTYCTKVCHALLPLVSYQT